MNMGETLKIKEIKQGYRDCVSTHGGAGWMYGSYRLGGNKIVCGFCGAIIEISSTKLLPDWIPDYEKENKTGRGN